MGGGGHNIFINDIDHIQGRFLGRTSATVSKGKPLKHKLPASLSKGPCEGGGRS